MSGPSRILSGDAAPPAAGTIAAAGGFGPGGGWAQPRLSLTRIPAALRAAASRAAPLLVATAVVAAGALAGHAAGGIVLAFAAGLGAAAGAALLVRAAARSEASRRLWEARARAAEAESRAKSLFLAEMSHELRTPLNTVMGFSEMMAAEVLGPHRVAAYGGYARDIHASGSHLLALADDLLDLARIESGHRSLMETPVRLDLLAQDCLGMMRPQAEARAVTLAQETQDAPRMWGDERALRQIILNLMANAVKFTPGGGAVLLRAGIDADGAPFLAVEDTGPGIADGELPLGCAHAGESRLDLATGRGAGLGLAIVRGLAALHGGTLKLTRRSGGGTSARVAFPRARAMARL